MSVAGVDVGGTHVRAAVYGSNGACMASVSTGLRRERSVIDQVSDLIAALEAETGRAASAIGVGIPGQVDQRAGVVRHALNLGIGDRGLPIVGELGDRFSVPVTVENDVRMGAVGALLHLRAQQADVDDLVYIGIGTGISAGIVIGGQLHRGRRGLAGEIGHIPISSSGPVCRCGLEGCIEAVAAGPAVAALWPGGASALFAAADEGDATATDPARQIALYLTRMIHALLAAYDPDVVVLGGGVGTSGAALVTLIEECMADFSTRSEFARVLLDPRRVVALPEHVSVGTMGAAELARRVLENKQVSGTPE